MTTDPSSRTNTYAEESRDEELLHKYLERSVERWPNAIAIEVPPGVGRPARQQLSYSELWRESGVLAAHLQSRVVGECVVCILLPRDSALLYTAQLAVLRAGAAYTCIDPSFANGRIHEILGDAEAVALLTDTNGIARLSGASSREVPLINVCDELSESTSSAQTLRTPSWLTPSSLAYVIYTSGTTGRPKGVLIEHRGIANLVGSDLIEFSLAVGDRVVQGSSAAYDSSVEETWLALASGATLVVMDEKTARLGPDLVDWLRSERITVFCPPPTLLRATGCEDPAAALPDLKLLYVGGEALPQDVADRWACGRRMVNGYGPTECSVTSVRGDVASGESIGIGRPVQGISACVLDEALNEVPAGEQGELCLGGIGLARGYWKDAALTAQKFIDHPKFGRLYRTGDLVHQDPASQFFYAGRIDAQVKLRGHRIELAGIEAILAECVGVRVAACNVQSDGNRQTLVAFVVPDDVARPPDLDRLKSDLTACLPAHMVPARLGVLAALPTTVGGKLNRAALPRLELKVSRARMPHVEPQTPMELLIERAFRDTLRIDDVVSINDDFFSDLGGDSLSAALLITQLRGDGATAWVTVRDIYEARTIAGLAKRVPVGAGERPAAEVPRAERQKRWPFWVTAAQAAWLLLMFVGVSAASYWLTFELLPKLANGIGLVPTVLLAPLLAAGGMLAYIPLSLGMAVLTKRLLVGRYQAARVPVWGGFYLRHWIVQQTVGMVPWRVLEGTVMHHEALRALGARIGQRVHIHRGVNLRQGGWDLLDIGDDVTLNHSAALQLVELVDGEMVFAPVSIGDGATIGIRALVGGGASIEAGAFITALSSVANATRVPRFECWNGIPARPVGDAPAAAAAAGAVVSPASHAVLMSAARTLVALALVIPLEFLTVAVFVGYGLGANDLWAWTYQPSVAWSVVTIGLAVVVVSVPLTLLFEMVLMRLLGPIPIGAINCWSIEYIRVWLKADLVESAGRWLSGTVFWPYWLRGAGMKVGAGCEISTIIDVIPEHIEIGAQSFFADGIYLGGPAIHRGVATLAHTRVGENTFLGNHVVIPAGQQLPDGILLGVCTVADDGLMYRGSSWFGLPPFELPRREIIAVDRRLTHQPSSIRYASRVFWELLRFALPITPLLVLMVGARALSSSETAGMFFYFVVVPAASFAAVGFLCLVPVVLKWALLGRVSPGQHGLWSCWSSRWDFLYVAWGQYAAPVLSRLEGSLLLNWYLRLMGMHLGSRVVLGPGFSQVVDPDMIHIEDDATVSASYQAHTFEDRVLKIDHVYVRRGATVGSNVVPLYGADIGEATYVAPHSVIMKRERLLPGRRYEGAPTR
jgi:non-ribosomal peptide synthetase-like protein